MENLTLSESNRRWQVLLKRRDQALQLTTSGTQKRPRPRDDDNDDEPVVEQQDPFDCQAIVIPSVNTLVEQVLDEFAGRWEELDYRKIVDSGPSVVDGNNDDDDDDDDDDGDNAQEKGDEGTDDTNTNTATQDDSNDPPIKKKSRKKPILNHLTLPPNFDYATRLAQAPVDDGSGDRVVNLLNPNETFSYERELWNLFASVPTVDDIHQQLLDGVEESMPHASTVTKEVLHAFGVNFRADGHALSRMRYNDRHEMVPLLLRHSKTQAVTENLLSADKSTIRFECWKKSLKRGSSPEENRAVLEFLGSQTLLELHRTIVELMQDRLWGMSPTDDETTNTRASTTHNDINSQSASGCFFIENQFYTFGSVDYAATIQKWLSASQARKTVLGISRSSPLQQIEMKDVKLKDIPWRFNVRYFHVHHGDVECAVYVTDLRHGSSVTTPEGKPLAFPFIHDCWPPSIPYMLCDACAKLPTSVLTSTKCTITQGHRGLCIACYNRLTQKKKST